VDVDVDASCARVYADEDDGAEPERKVVRKLRSRPQWR
jgi:hypothetical protein